MSITTLIISAEQRTLGIKAIIKNSTTYLLSVKQAESMVAKRENFTISSLFKEPSPKNVPEKKKTLNNVQK